MKQISSLELRPAGRAVEVAADDGEPTTPTKQPVRGDALSSPGTPVANIERRAASSPAARLSPRAMPAADVGGRDGPEALGPRPWPHPAISPPPAPTPWLGPHRAFPPRGPAPISAHETAAIVAQFVAAVPRIFGANLDYAFICGSVARGHAIRGDAQVPGDDIDTFVVLHRREALQVRAFEAWLGQLHARHRLCIDPAYPYEVVTREDLDTVVWPRLASTRLNLTFNSSVTFDTVTWAEMVSSDKVGVVGSASALAGDVALATPHVRRWLQEVRQALAREGEFADKALAYQRSRAAAGEGQAGREELGKELSGLSLPRLMRRVVPSPEAPPPPGTTEIAEAMMHLPVLRGQKVMLRPLRQDDDRALFEMCRLPEVARFCSWSPHAELQETRDFLAEQVAARHRGAANSWAICLRGTDVLIGTCGLVSISEENQNAQLGIAVHPRHHKKGVGHEALTLVMAFCRDVLGLHKIQAESVDANTASQVLLLKVGLLPEGVLRDEARKDGVFQTLVRYAWLRHTA